jgi:outer membrane putative beta-barrel porin/alpha-amylase
VLTRRCRVVLCVASAVVAGMTVSPAAFAQDPSGGAPPIALSDPDRPDVTNGARLVDVGLLQLEGGALYTHAAPGHGAFGSPLTLRLGALQWLEARIGTDGYRTQSDGTTRITGIGNVQVGAKLRLWETAAGVPVLSVLPSVNLPTAGKGLGSTHADYTVALLTGADLTPRAHVDVNYGIGAIGSPGDEAHFVQHALSASASAAVSDTWNPYVEAFWLSRQEAGGRGSTSIDAGAIYQVVRRCALDGGLQFGVSANAPRVAAFAGISVLIGDVLGSYGAVERRRRAEQRAAAAATRR